MKAQTHNRHPLTLQGSETFGPKDRDLLLRNMMVLGFLFFLLFVGQWVFPPLLFPSLPFFSGILLVSMSRRPALECNFVQSRDKLSMEQGGALGEAVTRGRRTMGLLAALGTPWHLMPAHM